MIAEKERLVGQGRLARRPEDAAYDILKSGQGWQPVSGGGFRCFAAGANILVEKKEGKIKVSIKRMGQDVFMQVFSNDGSNKFSLFYKGLEEKKK